MTLAAAAAATLLASAPKQASADDLTTGLIFDAAAAGYNPLTGSLTARVGPGLTLNSDSAAPAGDLPGLVMQSNGSYSIAFDGLQNYNFNATVGGGGNFTVLGVVLSATTTSTAGSIVAGGPGTVQFRTANQLEVLSAGVTSYGLSNTALSQTSLSVVGASIGSGAGPTQFYLNGSPDGSINTSNGMATGFNTAGLSRLGARQVGVAGSAEYFSGDMAEVRVYSGILTAAQVASISATLANTYLNANNNLYYTGNTNGSFDNATPNFYSVNTGSTAFTAGNTSPVYFQDVNESTDPTSPTLVANNNLTVPASGITATGGLVFNNYNVAYSFNNASGAAGVTGATSLTTTGAGTTTLLGANSFTGPVTISGGTLVAANNAALGNTSGVTVNLGALGLQGGITLPATVPITINGGGITNVSDTNTLQAAITMTNVVTTFNAASGTLNVGSNLATQGSALYMGGPGTINQLGTISGSSPLVKFGTGTLNLPNANTYTGVTSVGLPGSAGGTLVLGNTAALGTTANLVQIQNASTVQLTSDTGFGTGLAPLYNVYIGNASTGVGYTVNLGLGRATAGASNSITQQFGTLTMSQNGGLPLVLNIAPGINATSGIENLVINTLVAGNANSQTETLNPAGVNMTIGRVVPHDTNAITSSVDLDGNLATNQITGLISNNGSNGLAIVKTGVSTWTLTNPSNTYTGGNTVQSGSLVAGAVNAFGAGGTVTINSSTGSTAVLNLNNFNNTTGSLSSSNASLGAGTISLGSGNLTIVANVGLGAATYTGSITGTGSVTTSNSGNIQVFQGSNTYTGATNLNAAALLLSSTDAAKGTSGFFVTNTGLILASQNYDATSGPGITIRANQPITLSAGTLAIEGGLYNVVNSVVSGTGATSGSFGSTAIYLNNVYTVVNPGSTPTNLTLNGANTYTGTTTIGSTAATAAYNISAGTLTGGNVAAFGNTSAILFNKTGTLQLATDTGFGAGGATQYNISIGGIQQAGGFTSTVALGRATAGATTPITHTFNSVAISGQGAIEPETFAVTPGINASTGADTLSVNTLVYGNTVSAYEILSPATGTKLAIGNVFLVPSVRSNQVENLFLDGTATGNTISGTIQNGAQSPSTSSAIGAITKSNTGTWTVSGSNTYTGPTSVNAGHLVAGSATAFGAAPNVVMGFDPTASLDLGGNSMTFASLSGGAPGGTAVTLAGANLTVGSGNLSTAYYGAITGTGTFVKSGTGSLTVGGSSNYVGSTSVNAGTLRLAPAVTPVKVADNSFQFIRNVNGDNGTGYYTYNPTGVSWTFNGNSGVISTGSAFGFAGNTTGATGILGDTQYAFIQTSGPTATTAPGSTGAAQGSPGQVSQSINYPSAGSYALSFYSEQRGSQSQHLTIYSDPGVNISSGGVTPATNWTQYTYIYPESAGAHTLVFEGQALNGSDNSAAIDDVSVSGVATSNGSNGIPSTSAVIIAGGATFDVNNTIAGIGSLTGTSTAAVMLGSTTIGKLTTGNDGTNSTFSGSISGAGSLAKVGAGTLVLGGSSSFSGGTTLSGGTIRADGVASTGTGTVLITSGGALAGIGTAGPVTVAAGGKITAGSGALATDSTGNLSTGLQTWNSSGAYVAKFAAANTTNDVLVMSGLTVSAANGSPFVINVQGGSLATASGSYVLAVDKGATGDPFVLASLSLQVNGAAAPAGYALAEQTDTTGLGGTDLFLSVTAAPEPTSLLLLAGGIVPLTLGRRRRAARAGSVRP